MTVRSYCLVYDSVIGDVLYARDKWLRRGGKIIPDRATLFLAAIRKEEYPRGLEWWNHGGYWVLSSCAITV